MWAVSEEELLNEAAGALTASDTNAIMRLYADDAVFEDVPSGESFHGQLAVRRMFEALFTPSTRFHVARIRAGPGWGALEWVWSGRTRKTGMAFDVRGVSVLDISGSRITKEAIYYDPTPSRA